MRLLWVTAEPPDRAGGGGNIRQAHLLDAVAGAGHQIDLLLAGPDPDAETAAAVYRMLRPPTRPSRRPTSHQQQRLLGLRLAVWGGPAELYDNRGARRALSSAWPNDEYDVVLVEHAGLAPLISHRRHRERWVCTLHNIASGTADALKELAPGRRQRLLIARDGRQAAKLERFVVEKYDSVISVSAEDADLLPGLSVVVPNGVDLKAFMPTPLPATPTLLFTGTLSYLPNVDGLRWFCDSVLPRLRTLVPEVVFHIVGRDPTPAMRALANLDNVVVHADVPAVTPYLHGARVCVVPLRMGTGSRLKALEAMAAGRPLVGTTVGLAGLGITDQAVVEDHPVVLADALARLLLHDGDAQRLASAGRDHVEQAFGWPSVGSRLVRHLEEVSSR